MHWPWVGSSSCAGLPTILALVGCIIHAMVLPGMRRRDTPPIGAPSRWPRNWPEDAPRGFVRYLSRRRGRRRETARPCLAGKAESPLRLPHLQGPRRTAVRGLGRRASGIVRKERGPVQLRPADAPPEGISFLYLAVADLRSPSEIASRNRRFLPHYRFQAYMHGRWLESRAGFPRSHMGVRPRRRMDMQARVSPAQANELARHASGRGRPCAGQRTRTDIDPFGPPEPPAPPAAATASPHLPPVLVTTPPMRKAATAKKQPAPSAPADPRPPQPRSRRRRQLGAGPADRSGVSREFGRSTRNHN